MEKNCLYCQTPFTTNREGKKYCSDNCKQMAYLERNGLKRVGTERLGEVKYEPLLKPIQEIELMSGSEEETNFDQENTESTVNDVKQNKNVNHVNTSVNSEGTKPISESALPDAALESLFNKLNQTLEQKLDSAVKQIREEFYGKAQSNKTDFTARDHKESADTTPAFAKTNQDQKFKNTVSARDTESGYNWVESKLLKKAEKYFDQLSGGLKFRTPRDYWDIQAVYCISWINTRLKCLLEYLIRFSNTNCVDRQSVIALTNAFTDLENSNAFAHLPADYPFTTITHNLSSTLRELISSGTAEEFKVHFSLQRKALLIAIVRCLTNTYPTMKFVDLDFTEDENLFYKSPLRKSEYEQPSIQELKGWRARAFNEQRKHFK